MTDGPSHAPQRRRLAFARELPVLVLIAFGLALLIKTFVVQAFFIPSESMERTLHGCKGCSGDRVLVNKLVYDVRDIRRGEIVVFNGIDSWTPDTGKDFVKRVIGLPGDRVACCTHGHVTVQARGTARPVELVESYVYQDDHRVFCAAGASESACPAGAPGVLVPPHRLWVMGDHREFSSDSRAHMTDSQHGTIPVGKVIGRAFVIVWPVHRFRVLSVPKTFGG
ncbi:MAG: signal peptidase [Actinomycetota bacterium]|nr:signal peptidase [Actinomycetota bacterium]